MAVTAIEDTRKVVLITTIIAESGCASFATAQPGGLRSAPLLHAELGPKISLDRLLALNIADMA